MVHIVFPSNLYVESLTPNVMVFGDGALMMALVPI